MTPKSIYYVVLFIEDNIGELSSTNVQLDPVVDFRLNI